MWIKLNHASTKFPLLLRTFKAIWSQECLRKPDPNQLADRNYRRPRIGAGDPDEAVVAEGVVSVRRVGPPAVHLPIPRRPR